MFLRHPQRGAKRSFTTSKSALEMPSSLATNGTQRRSTLE